MDVDEKKRYENFLLAGGDPKDYKHVPPYQEERRQNDNPVQMILDALTGGDVKMFGRKGAASGYADVSGRKVFRLSTGEIVDENGQPYKSRPGERMIPLKEG